MDYEGFNIEVGGIAIGPWHPDFASARLSAEAMAEAGVSDHRIVRALVEVEPDYSIVEPQEMTTAWVRAQDRAA